MGQVQILIVEDRRTHRNMLADEIKNDPDTANCVLSMAESFSKVKDKWEENFIHNPPDIVILDHFLSGSHDGTHVARWMLNKSPSLRIIVNTAYPFMDTDDGVAYQGYIKLKEEGYYVNFLHKDSKSKTEGIPIWHGVLRPALIEAIDAIKTAKGEMSDSFRNLCSRLCAKSKPFMECLKSVERVMSSDINVLLLGDNGTGKEKVAREIHKGSKRKNGPFVPVNCAAIPESLIEAEFFGYQKGAFSGAVRDHRGFFLQASGGTLLLDEVTEIPMHLQPKLLRAIQQKEIQRLGDEKKYNIDIRILSATNRDIADAVHNNAFREDLYYRLNKITIVIPPLRKRRDDIIPLAKLFINNFYQENNEFSDHALSPTAEKVLEKYQWPGNVRQLENIIEETLIKVGPERHQIAPTDFQFPKDHEQKVHKKPDERKDTLTNEDEAYRTRETIKEKSWFSELDKDQLIKLCRKIWMNKGSIIDNEVNNIIEHVSNFPGHPLLNTRFVLAVFFVAHLDNKKSFGRDEFDKIFGFSKSTPLRNWLEGKSKSQKEGEYFPQYKGEDGKMKLYLATQLKQDGYKLKKNGISLDVSNS